MNLALAAPGIRFNDCFFTEPVPLDAWAAPRFTGLFVILASDPNWAPKSFQPLCFGELGNNTATPLERNGYGWLLGLAGRKGLFVSVLPLPFSTSGQRATLRHELIAAYNPVLQPGGVEGSPDELARRIDEMEKRHQEHSAQVLMLLGNIHKHFEPLPVPPRRTIGFQPESA